MNPFQWYFHTCGTIYLEFVIVTFVPFRWNHFTITWQKKKAVPYQGFYQEIGKFYDKKSHKFWCVIGQPLLQPMFLKPPFIFLFDTQWTEF